MTGAVLSGRKYRAYPEYKDSGIEWIGKTPNNWNTPKLLFLSNAIGDGLHSTPKYTDGTGYYFINGNNLDNGKINLAKGAKEVSVDEYEKHHIHLDCNTVFLSINGTIGNVAIYNGESIILGKSAAYVRCDTNLLPTFLMYAFQTIEIKNYFNLEVTGTTISNLSLNTIRGMRFGLPSPEEQQKIADFLDHETAKIDTLISKQEKLIELLKEKRQTVISHTVTRGLTPDAPMKDSGVEWLGEVPEHWIVSKFRYQALVVRGGSPRPAGDPTLFNGDFSPWVTVAEITKDDEIYLTNTATHLTKKGSDQCRVFSKGTLVISNSGATLGVPKILSIDANANDGVVGFENLNINSEYAYFYLSTLTEGLRDRIKQGSGQPNLNTDIIKDIQIPLPPEAEVTEIVKYIKDVRTKFSLLTEKATKAIKLMKERKTALISAAVTGKIDVRNYNANKAGN